MQKHANNNPKRLDGRRRFSSDASAKKRWAAPKERPSVLLRQCYFEAGPLGAEGRTAAGLGAAGTAGGGAGTPDFAL